MKCLIVDDSKLMQDRILEVVEKISGIEIVGQAKNSLEAYQMFNKYNPDLVILDIRLPGENGVQILEKLKKINNFVKIIVLTNYPYPQYRNKCLELGAESFLHKSDEFDQLPFVLENIVNMV